MPTAPSQHSWRRFLPLAALALALVLAYFFRLQDLISIETLRNQRAFIDSFIAENFIAAILIYVVAYALGICTSLPLSIPLTLAGGYAFGVWPGLASSWCGAMLGALAVFLAARTALGDVLRRHASPWLKGFEAGFQQNALNYLIALRLTPVTPFWIVNLAAPLLEVRLRDYLIGTAIGIIPIWFVIVSVGAALHDAFEAGVALDPGTALRNALLSPSVLAALAGIFILVLAPVLIRRLRPR